MAEGTDVIPFSAGAICTDQPLSKAAYRQRRDVATACQLRTLQRSKEYQSWCTQKSRRRALLKLSLAVALLTGMAATAATSWLTGVSSP